MKLTDPGKGRLREEAKTERLKVWAPPKTKTAKKKLFDKRKADWEARHVGNIS